MNKNYVPMDYTVEDFGFFHAAIDFCTFLQGKTPLNLVTSFDENNEVNEARTGWGMVIDASSDQLGMDNASMLCDMINLALAIVKHKSPEIIDPELEACIMNTEHGYGVYAFTEQPDREFPGKALAETVKQIKNVVLIDGWKEMTTSKDSHVFLSKMPDAPVNPHFVADYFNGLNPYAAIALDMLSYLFEEGEFDYLAPTDDEVESGKFAPISIALPAATMKNWREMEIKAAVAKWN